MMKSKLLNSLMLVALAVPGVAMAAEAETTAHKEDKHVIPASAHTVTANVGLVSDYVWRGISQTDQSPAIQGGIDYAHSSGLYAGVWGSNVSWIIGSGAATGNAGLELDTYAGFKNSFAGDFTYDIGLIRYNYPGKYTPAAGYAKADTDEVYGAIGYKWITAKYSYGLGKFLTIPGAEGTSYFDLSASYPIAGSGFTVGAHVGKQTYKGAAAAANAAGSLTYTDYKLSVTKDIGGYVVGLAYTDTNAVAAAYTYAGRNWSRGTAVLSLNHSF
ncbi:MAG: hypothetical protein EPN14_04290 [Gallionella sp.]|nr:MAG: hypothetical protein EPN14_04290 [Gallionella sp.]